MGLCYISEIGVTKDEKKAVEFFSKAAIGNSMNGKAWLGYCHLYGIGVKKDTTLGISSLKEAADKSNLWAHRLLITYYNSVSLVLQTTDWCHKLSQLGTAADKRDVGIRFLKGDNMANNCVVRDYKIAVPLLKDAAVQGDIDAQYYLGLCYAKGYGVEKSIILAKIWLEQATGHKKADQLRSNL